MPNPWSYTVQPGPLGPMTALAGLGTYPALPLQGVTVLAVEDSRFACEALRLMCQRAGARLRRAESLSVARAHLRVYRPDVVIIDLGLPDGRGEALIADLARSPQRPIAVLGTSGNPMGRACALDAGADGFIDKPYASVLAFCAELQTHLHLPCGGAVPTEMPAAALSPDPMALHDDLALAARALAGEPDAATRRYVARFLSGIAAHAKDPGLAEAATLADGATADHGFRRLRDLIADRLAAPPPFLRETS